MTYIFDANSILRLIEKYKYQSLRYFRQGYSPSLVGYELGNVLWKYSKMGIDVGRLLNPLNEVLSSLTIVDVHSSINNEILDISIRGNITYYDASYIYLAKKLGVMLVTEDRELLRKFPGYTMEPDSLMDA